MSCLLGVRADERPAGERQMSAADSGAPRRLVRASAPVLAASEG